MRHLYKFLIAHDFILKVVTVVVAICGAILSAYTFMEQRKGRMKRIRVSLRVGRKTWKNNLLDSEVILKATNYGHRMVKLVGCCITLPGGVKIRDVELEGKPFPIELRDGDSYECCATVTKIALKLPENSNSLRAHIFLNGEFWDGTDEKFKSKRMSFCVSDYSAHKS